MSDFKIELLESNTNRLQLLSEDENKLIEARTLFSYIKKQYGGYYINSYLDGTGFYSCISPTYTFKKGLGLEIAKKLKEAGYTVNINSNLKEILQPKTHWINEQNLIQPKANFVYRDYQENSIKSVKKFGRGILEIPTSGGKSLILFGICNNIKEYSTKTLIIVPRLNLVEQFYKEWQFEYGYSDIAMYSKQCPVLNEKAKVIITNVQWLQAKRNSKSPDRGKNILNAGFKAIIIDECHTLGEPSSWFTRFLSKFKTPYKLGCTGTVPDEKSKRWNVIGLLGPVLYRKEVAELQEKNQIARVKIFPIELEHNNQLNSELPWLKKRGETIIRDKITGEPLDGKQMFEAEYKYLESHNGCNNLILDIAEKLKGNTVILVDHKEHAKYLYEHCRIKNKFLITGDVKISERNQAASIIDIKDDSKQYIIIAICSAFGTGTSIKNLQNLIIASHGKALTKIIQNAGRVLRKLKRDGEEEYGNIIDIYHNKLFSEKHFKSRLKLYRKIYHKQCKIYKHYSVPSGTQNEIRDNLEQL